MYFVPHKKDYHCEKELQQAKELREAKDIPELLFKCVAVRCGEVQCGAVRCNGLNWYSHKRLLWGGFD